MKPAPTIIAVLCLIALATAQQRPPRAQKIFNGKDLQGWKGDPSGWAVESGILTGRGSGSPREPLVLAAGPVDDFELTLEARIRGGAEATVRYRGSYQLSLSPGVGGSGSLSESGRRGLLARRGVQARAGEERNQIVGKLRIRKPSDIGEWNTYKIIARGNRLIHQINGEVVSSLVDEHPDRRSLEGTLELHLGGADGATFELREIVLRRYPRAHVAAPPDKAIPEKPSPSWITTADPPEAGEQLFLRRPWRQADKDVTGASLAIAATHRCRVFVNGVAVGEAPPGAAASTFDVTRALQPYHNTLAVLAAEMPEGSRIAVDLRIVHRDGSASHITSDRRWTSLSASEEPDGWQTNLASRRGWTSVEVLGRVEATPWGDPFALPEAPSTISPPTEQRMAPGFELTKIYEVPLASQGSWVAITAAGTGKLYASAQQGSIYEILLADQDRAAPEVRAVDVPIGAANGLQWFDGSLYAIVNSEEDSGLYQIGDSDSDGRLDSIHTLQTFDGHGELGPHAIALLPDGLGLAVAGGKHTKIPDKIVRRRPPDLARADQLLRLPGSEIEVPGAWICSVRSGGAEWELLAVGLRNPYRLAFNHLGDLFTSDSDAPSDYGIPSFRPSSVFHVPSGADFGARGRAANFPAGYPDTLPPVATLSPGSPTGLIFGSGSAFPRRYQRALFVCDWSRRSIEAVRLEAKGASYQVSHREEFAVAPDLRVTDIAIGGDGAMYVTSGGRGLPSALWRIEYLGSGDDTDPVAPQPPPPDVARTKELHARLCALHGITDERAIATAWPHLAHTDRMVRHAARTAIEHFPPEKWLDRFGEEARAQAILESALALARAGNSSHSRILVEKLHTLEFEPLAPDQKIAFLRILGLTSLRLASGKPVARAELESQLLQAFPSGDAALDIELSRLLIHSATPGSIEKTVAQLANSQNSATFASFLAVATRGWTQATKMTYQQWFKVAPRPGLGSYFPQYLEGLETEFSREKSDEDNE